jgi:hypothetical protein
MTLSITRTRHHRNGTTELYTPHCYQSGEYKVFKRYPGDSKDKASGATPISFAEIPQYLANGYSLWMSGARNKDMGLISPGKVEVS